MSAFRSELSAQLRGPDKGDGKGDLSLTDLGSPPRMHVLCSRVTAGHTLRSGISEHFGPLLRLVKFCQGGRKSQRQEPGAYPHTCEPCPASTPLTAGDRSSSTPAPVHSFLPPHMPRCQQISEHFGPLFRLVKAWAKAHYMNDGANHTFNSWCLTLMVAFYMQRRQQQV